MVRKIVGCSRLRTNPTSKIAVAAAAAAAAATFRPLVGFGLLTSKMSEIK